jgi:hypothetical protein
VAFRVGVNRMTVEIMVWLLMQERKKERQQLLSSGSVNLAAAFEKIAKDVLAKDWESIPSDLSINLDHYLYGR